MRCLTLALATVAMTLMSASLSAAQSPAPGSEGEEGRQRDPWYYSSSYEKPTPQMIIQQKAQARAAARIRRIETMAAYGMSNSRPTALPVPTGLYSPAWQMPGGRPNGWYATYQPQYIILR